MLSGSVYRSSTTHHVSLSALAGAHPLANVQRLAGLFALPGSIIGLAKSLSALAGLRVQAGDEVDLEVYGKYYQPEPGAQNTNALALIATPLLQAFGVPVPPEGLSVLQTTASDIAAGGIFINKTPEDPTVQAYLNYLLFDDDFAPVASGFVMLSPAAKQGDEIIDHEKLSIQLPIAKDGYLYTYLSNESSKVAEVYFDDYKITHRKLVPDVAYGTEAVAYRYGFNGKEKDQSGEWGLTAYDYGFRIYNPALGRFLSLDPLTGSYPMLTPYQFASNTPVMAIDLDGLEAVITIGEKQLDGTVIQIQQEIDPNEFTQAMFQKSYPNLPISGSVSIIIDKNGKLLEYQYIPEYIVEGSKPIDNLNDALYAFGKGVEKRVNPIVRKLQKNTKQTDFGMEIKIGTPNSNLEGKFGGYSTHETKGGFFVEGSFNSEYDPNNKLGDPRDIFKLNAKFQMFIELKTSTNEDVEKGVKNEGKVYIDLIIFKVEHKDNGNIKLTAGINKKGLNVSKPGAGTAVKNKKYGRKQFGEGRIDGK